MQIEVLLFASLDDESDQRTLSVELPEGATVAQLRNRLGAENPRLAVRLPQIRIAVNQEFAGDDTVINEGAEVALIPPVSGG